MAKAYGTQVPGPPAPGYPADPSFWQDPLGRFFAGLRLFFLGTNYVKTVPKPFDKMRVGQVFVPFNTDVWLDPPTSRLINRRAWAIINPDPVAGNTCWVNSVPMTAAGQGGPVLAQGGTASIPGSEAMPVHVFTNVAAGVTVGFYQFA